MSRKKLRLIVSTFSILFILPIPVLGVNTLEVLCVDQNGNPINKVKVFLQGIGSSEKPEDERSGKDGIAQFEKLPDDLYRVWAHEKDFEKVLWISDNQKPYFSRYSDQLRMPEKIQETDIYVETRMNPDEVAKTALKLREAFGYNQDDLSIDAR